MCSKYLEFVQNQAKNICDLGIYFQQALRILYIWDSFLDTPLAKMFYKFGSIRRSVVNLFTLSPVLSQRKKILRIVSSSVCFFMIIFCM